MDKQETDRAPADDSLSYLEDLEQSVGIGARIIDLLIDMVYLAAEDKTLLTPEVCGWLDGLQEHALSVAEAVGAADAED